MTPEHPMIPYTVLLHAPDTLGLDWPEDHLTLVVCVPDSVSRQTQIHAAVAAARDQALDQFNAHNTDAPDDFLVLGVFEGVQANLAFWLA